MIGQRIEAGAIQGRVWSFSKYRMLIKTPGNTYHRLHLEHLPPIKLYPRVQTLPLLPPDVASYPHLFWRGVYFRKTTQADHGLTPMERTVYMPAHQRGIGEVRRRAPGTRKACWNASTLRSYEQHWRTYYDW